MDETTKAIIEKITTRHPTPVSLPGGGRSTVVYDCSLLSPNDLARMAAEATGDLPEGTFDAVIGLAYRGILFAASVAGGHQVIIMESDGKLCGPPIRGRRVVIVDDVVHSGEHLLNARALAEGAGATVVGFACIVDRSTSHAVFGALPLWSAFCPHDV
jgi:orotate phosphoribosyltransferase